MYVSRNRKSVFLYLKKWYKLLLIFSTLTFLFSLVFPNNNTLFIQKITLIFIILFLLKKYTNKINKSLQGFLDVLATYSFGLYFIHDYFDVSYKYVLMKTIGTPFLNGSLLLWAVNFSITILLSILTLKTLKYLFGSKSKEIIGC